MFAMASNGQQYSILEDGEFVRSSDLRLKRMLMVDEDKWKRGLELMSPGKSQCSSFAATRMSFHEICPLERYMSSILPR
jgi:hypothetical protein